MVNTVSAMNSGDVVAALRKHYPADRYAFLEQVGNGTGYAVSRHIDALVMSLWPSRGLDLTAIEIKVSRSDWKRELDNPRKAEEIACYCDFFCVAAPKGIVEPFSLPATWGLLEVSNVVTVVTAPSRLEPKTLNRTFLAAVFRQGQRPETMVQQIRAEEMRAAREASEAAIDALAEQKISVVRQDYSKLKSRVEAFEAATGVPLENHTTDFYGYPNGEALGRAVLWLAKHDRQEMARILRRAASDADRAAADAREAADVIGQADAQAVLP
jgi:hypothetical protein